MLANNLIAKLKTLEKKEIDSITIRAGIINKGTPLGKKTLKILLWWYNIPQIRFTVKYIIEK